MGRDLELFLCAGVGDIVHSILATQYKNIENSKKIRLVCSDVQKETCVSIARILYDTYFSHLPFPEIAALPKEEFKEMMADIEELNPTDFLTGPRFLYRKGVPVIGAWPGFTRDVAELSKMVSCWSGMYALFNNIGGKEYSSFLMQGIPDRSLDLNNDERKKVTLFLSLSANSMKIDMRHFLENSFKLLKFLSQKNNICIKLHMPPQKSTRPDIDDAREMENVSDIIYKLTSSIEGASVDFVSGSFDQVLKALSSSDLMFSPRSGLGDVAYILGVPQISAYNNLNDQKFYRLTKGEKTVITGDGRSVLSFQLAPAILHRVFDK